MTKDQAIKIAKRALRAMAKACEDPPNEYGEALAELGEDKPLNDIPIGHPCEGVSRYDFDNGIAETKLYYYNGNGKYVDALEDFDGITCGYVMHTIRPLTVWDIDERYGGAPEWAIARAYDNHLGKTMWCVGEGSVDVFLADPDYIVERRPEGN